MPATLSRSKRSKISKSKENQVILACTVCGQRNYTTVKSVRLPGDRMTLNKHCPHCNQHTAHQETR